MYVCACLYVQYYVCQLKFSNERNPLTRGTIRLLQANLDYKYTVSIRETSPLVTT